MEPEFCLPTAAGTSQFLPTLYRVLSTIKYQVQCTKTFLEGAEFR
jgi:hypothetical protein